MSLGAERSERSVQTRHTLVGCAVFRPSGALVGTHIPDDSGDGKEILRELGGILETQGDDGLMATPSLYQGRPTQSLFDGLSGASLFGDPVGRTRKDYRDITHKTIIAYKSLGVKWED